MKKNNVIYLFSGCGGLSYGFHIDHDYFNIIFSNEIDSQIAETYKYNYPLTKIYTENINCLA